MEYIPEKNTTVLGELDYLGAELIEKQVYYIDSLFNNNNLNDSEKFNSKTETFDKAIRVNVDLVGAGSNPIDKVGIKLSGFFKKRRRVIN